jgi:hypothetical protein
LRSWSINVVITEYYKDNAWTAGFKIVNPKFVTPGLSAVKEEAGDVQAIFKATELNTILIIAKFSGEVLAIGKPLA